MDTLDSFGAENVGASICCQHSESQKPNAKNLKKVAHIQRLSLAVLKRPVSLGASEVPVLTAKQNKTDCKNL